MKKLFVILIFLSATQSFAASNNDLFGEVYLGYDSSRIAATNVSGPHENGRTSGFAVMARAGYLYSIFLLGVEIWGSAGSLTYDLSQIKSGYWNKTFTSVVAGFDLGLIRIWGNYGVTNEMRLALDYGTYITDKIYSGGTCYKAGVGFALSKRIHLNAEYYVNTPDKMQNAAGPINWGATYNKWQETGYIFSVSYNLFGNEIKSR